ncbi:MAG: GIY-YIG nuclease family protein [Candidatus Bathyarchaeia archaeon]
MKGIYVLLLQVTSDIIVRVGAIGEIPFKKGLYVYVGSAQNNLEKRVQRHLKKEKHKFWHIDYLLDNSNVKVAAVFYKNACQTEECSIARVIGEKGRAVNSFGSSDCQCESHLFQINNVEFLCKIMKVLPLET